MNFSNTDYELEGTFTNLRTSIFVVILLFMLFTQGASSDSYTGFSLTKYITCYFLDMGSYIAFLNGLLHGLKSMEFSNSEPQFR